MQIPRLKSILTIMTMLGVVACAEQTSTEPDGPAAEDTGLRGISASIDCTAHLASGVISCEKSKHPRSGFSPLFHIVGGQGVYTQLTSSNVSYDGGTEVFQADVTVQNLLPGPLGTPDGSTVTGIRVFFHSGPTVTSGTGTVSVSNADGSETFTGSAQPYFEYSEMLAAGETTAAKTWMWDTPSTVSEFSFSVYVHADLSSLESSPLLALGDVQTCALMTSNDVRCWGENFRGVFGNATQDGSNVPVRGALWLRLRSLSVAILGSDWACGVTLWGSMFCWGSNEYGVLGPGAGAYETIPHLVPSGVNFALVEAGEKHACALTTTGDAYCWGVNEDFGNLGDGTLTNRTTPTAVLTTLTFDDIQAGAGFTCGLESSGNVYCWGSNLAGELGDGTTDNRSVPDSVSGNMRYVALSVGSYSACAVATDGRPYCWGANGSGELGDSSAYVNRHVPTLVSGGLTVQHISAGDNHTCAVDVSGAGWCWGEEQDGQLGNDTVYGAAVPWPTAVAGGLQWLSITAEEEHSCGVTIANEVYCWGSNYEGQLGVGPSPTGSNIPLKVQGLP